MKQPLLLRWLRPWHLPALGLLLLLLNWALRDWLEASMWRHMLLQFPLLLCAGAWLAKGLPQRWRQALQPFNQSGISGLLLCATVLAVLMIPRVLDLALRQPEIELLKHLALLAAGAGLQLSWRSAGLVLQSFFLGNSLAMMAIVGMLYMESPLRLCNAYLQDDQIRLGQWLLGCSIALALAWLGQVAWRSVRAEQVAA